MMTDEERYETPRQARERRERVAREREEALRSQGEAGEKRTRDREGRVTEDASERKRSWEESWRPPWATLAQAEGQPLNTMTRDQGDQLVALLTQIATNTKTQGGSGGGSLASRLGEASYFSAG
jgi:vacuolar-type H+-ATPase subunit B/Vma2